MSKSNQRTLHEIETEYGLHCAKAGDLQYRIFVLKEELKLINAQLKKLNQEANLITQQNGEEK